MEFIEPNGCRWCGVGQREHARMWHEGIGWHTWVEPTDFQRLQRMRNRRDRMWDRDKALGWLIVGAINDHFPHPDDDLEADEDFEPDMGNEYCTKGCGPCGALKEFSEQPQRRHYIDGLIRRSGWGTDDWCYWSIRTDSLRWDWFLELWAGHKACWRSNGETGCYDDEEEDCAQEG